ncbi:hypothetical protein NHX12_014448, partial [Muraenolepis orangiensis]
PWRRLFRKVRKCRPKNSSGRLVAVKEYLDSDIEHNIKPEIRLRHHNLLKALGGFVERGKLFGIFQLLDRDVVSELKGRYMGFGRDALRKYTFQILLGTHFHHSRD